MNTTTFTPAQRTFYNALKPIDVKLLTIARDVMTAWLATGLKTGPDPEDLGAPVNSSAWAVLEHAADVFDKAATGDDETNTRAALDVVNAVIASKNT